MKPKVDIGKKKREEKEEEGIRDSWSYETLRCLKQARRGERVAYRASMVNMQVQHKEEAYSMLNKEAIALLINHVNKEIKWEEECLV